MDGCGFRSFLAIAIVTLCTLVAFQAVGCSRTEYSGRLTEPASVEDIIFAPSQHGTGTGISMGSGNLVVSSIEVPEKYAVVFRCQHGKFIIEGDGGSTAHSLWRRLKRGQEVTVWYREVYRVQRSDGQRSLIDFDFLDAR